MKRNNYSAARAALIVIALLCACSPAAAPGAPPEPTIRPATPGPVAISRHTASQVVLLRTLAGHGGRALDVAFSAAGRLLVSSGEDLHIRVWDVSSGKEVHAWRMGSVDMADIDIWPPGALLASAEAIWNLDTLQEVYTLERGSTLPGSVAFSKDGSVLALGLFERRITLWDVASGQRLRSLETREENRTKAMDFSADGATLAAGVIDGTVRLLDVSDGRIVRVLKPPSETDIHDVAFSPDGKYLATGGRVPAVVLWDAASGEALRRFPLSDNSLSMAFAPDSTVLASSGGYEHEVRLWDVESGQLLHALPHGDHVMRVAFSPDGRLLAAACFDGHVYVWGIPAEA